MFGRATITLGIGPHSSCSYFSRLLIFVFSVLAKRLAEESNNKRRVVETTFAVVKKRCRALQLYVDQNHNIQSPGQRRHLFQSMTDFLLHDCWPPRALAAARTPSASGVVVATLVTSLVTRRRH